MNSNRPHFRIRLSIKRLIDLLASALALILLSPVLVVIAIAIKLDSPGRAIYSHRRVGKDGAPFSLYKFRSMTSGGDDTGYLAYLQQLIESEQVDGEGALPYRKMASDPRITRVGALLRRFYLDELPQLWNVVRGEMSLIGPRPHIQMEVDYYTRQQRRRLSVKPGLTGLWQVFGKGNSTFGELIQLDLEYIDHWSLKFDIQIIIYTLLLMFRGGEGVWARKAKEVPEKAMPVTEVFSFESVKQEERDWMLVKD
jgi:lipopolysaccharide/colanic/teichoic acid biosynthesis glycosyltransferase